MNFKTVAFYSACAATWLFLLPVLAAVGLCALAAYAVFSQIADTVLRRPATPFENSTAREIAQRMCVGN